MLKGHLTYAAPVKGDRLIAFPAKEIKPTHASVASITVSAPKPIGSQSGVIQITIKFSSVATEEEAALFAEQIVRNAIDRIAFEHSIWIDDPPVPIGEFTPVSGKTPGKAFAGIPMSVRGYMVVEPTGRDLERLTKKLNAKRIKGRLYYPLFRSALRTDNPVDKFLALYRIILLIHKDKQQDVDKFLYSEFKDKLTPRPGQKKQPGKKKIKETVFTKLRNEVAHIRKRTRLEKTRQRMEEYMDELIDRVKRAIEKKG